MRPYSYRTDLPLNSPVFVVRTLDIFWIILLSFFPSFYFASMGSFLIMFKGISFILYFGWRKLIPHQPSCQMGCSRIKRIRVLSLKRTDFATFLSTFFYFITPSITMLSINMNPSLSHRNFEGAMAMMGEISPHVISSTLSFYFFLTYKLQKGLKFRLMLSASIYVIWWEKYVLTNDSVLVLDYSDRQSLKALLNLLMSGSVGISTASD